MALNVAQQHSSTELTPYETTGLGQTSGPARPLRRPDTLNLAEPGGPLKLQNKPSHAFTQQTR